MDWTNPPSGDIIASDALNFIEFYFLVEMDTKTFSLEDDIISVDEEGNPGLSFAVSFWTVNPARYIPNARLMLIINKNSIQVDKCYYVTLKKGSINSWDGTALNNDIVVSVKVKSPDDSYPVFSSLPFGPTWWGQYKFISPHQPLRFRFSEPMGTISLFVEPSEGIKIEPILEVHDTKIDNMGVVIYRSNKEFPLSTDYEITFLSEDMTLKQRNGLPATQDVSGNPLGSPNLACLIFPQLPGVCMVPYDTNIPRSYPFRFTTSHIKFLTPLMDYLNDTPWSGYPPVYARVLTTNEVDKVVLQSDTGERPVEITGFTQSPDGRIFEGNFYFKQPGIKTLTAKGYSAGIFNGSDYVKVDIVPPPPEYWLALELNEDLIESAMGFIMLMLPWGIPGGETLLSFTTPYGCYDITVRKLWLFYLYNYHLYVSKSIFKFIPWNDPQEDYRNNFDISLLEDTTHSGFFIVPKSGLDSLVDISSHSIEVNTLYTSIPPVIIPEPPSPPGVNCLEETNVKSCSSDCIKCPEPPDPEFIRPPIPGLYKSIGKKIRITYRTKEIDFNCGYATVATAGVITCHDDLYNTGARIEGLNIRYDLVPVMLISPLNVDFLSPSISLPSPPYKIFFLIRDFKVFDIGGVSLTCIPNWIAEEALELNITKDPFEDSYQIDLQSKPEWGTYYFTGNIQVQEKWNPHEIKLYFEYLPGLRDN